MVKKIFLAENTAKNVYSHKTTTCDATQVAQNVNTINDQNLILTSNCNDIQNTAEILRPNNSSRVITDLTKNIDSVENNTTEVNYNAHKTVNGISHINHRPRNLFFNPSKLSEDNQYLINDNNTCEYYTDNEFVKSFTTSNDSSSILNLNIVAFQKI